jgi:hypothetical protein
LGNQFFQYATAYSLSKEKNMRLILDISFFYSPQLKFLDKRYFVLDDFDIEYDFISKKPINGFKIIREKDVYKETIFNFERNNKVKLIGYFLNPKNFEYYLNDLRKMVEFMKIDKKNSNFFNILKLINDTESVSVHIRRGDKLKLKVWCGICDSDFYKKGVNFFSKKLVNPKFFVFSNDIEWCKNNFKYDVDVIFVDYNFKETEDFYLMSKCKHNIIANSTFGWWAAYINNNFDKIVYSPEKWISTPNSKFLFEDEFK